MKLGANASLHHAVLHTSPLHFTFVGHERSFIEGRHYGEGEADGVCMRALRVRRMPAGDDLGTLEAELGRAGGAANEELLAILQQARASASVCGCFS